MSAQIIPVADTAAGWSSVVAIPASPTEPNCSLPLTVLCRTVEQATWAAAWNPAKVSRIITPDEAAAGALDKVMAGKLWGIQPFESKSTRTTNKASLLKLLGLVSRDAPNRDIEKVFKADPKLSYFFLKLVNSAAIGAFRTITSFNQALVILGRKQLKRWTNLLLFSDFDESNYSAMLASAARGKLTELIQGTEPDAAFMAGMFSYFPVVFGAKSESILKEISVDSAIIEGALKLSGPYGAAVRKAIDLWDPSKLADLPSETDAAWTDEAFTWAEHLMLERSN